MYKSKNLILFNLRRSSCILCPLIILRRLLIIILGYKILAQATLNKFFQLEDRRAFDSSNYVAAGYYTKNSNNDKQANRQAAPWVLSEYDEQYPKLRI